VFLRARARRGAWEPPCQVQRRSHALPAQRS